MIPEGRIVIDLHHDGTVRLQSNRSTQVGQLLVNRTAAEVLEILPMVFSLCAQAHVAAARLALGSFAGPENLRADTLVVLAENAREHLLRILICWPDSADRTGFPVPDVMALVDDMRRAVGDEQDETAVSDRLENLLEDHVLGISPTRFLQLETIEQLLGWAAAGSQLASRHLTQVMDQGWQGLGSVRASYLPELAPGELAMRMAHPSFAHCPDWQGEPRETGPLQRQKTHPLVAEIVTKYGAGLLARHVARLVDLARVPALMRQPGATKQHSPGLGIVETARGRLIHWARVRDGKVADYRIVAPTEWNFHPNGAAAVSLRNLGQAPDRAVRARAVIEAIDPCVEFEIRVA